MHGRGTIAIYSVAGGAVIGGDRCGEREDVKSTWWVC